MVGQLEYMAYGVKSMLLLAESLLRRLFLAIVCKHDVVHV